MRNLLIGILVILVLLAGVISWDVFFRDATSPSVPQGLIAKVGSKGAGGILPKILLLKG
jgi:hypothetical protein